MAPPTKKPIQGVQGVGPGVRNQSAMQVHVSAYQRAFRPRGKGLPWDERTEKSKKVSIKNQAKQLAKARQINNEQNYVPEWMQWQYAP